MELANPEEEMENAEDSGDEREEWII
jgi:hypothetical protein